MDSFTQFDEDVDKASVAESILGALSTFLQRHFPEYDKQKAEYKYASNRINFACPYCGDSDKNPKKKRGNIYLRNLWYKCFNCGMSTDVLSFLRDHDIDDALTGSEQGFLKDNTHVGGSGRPVNLGTATPAAPPVFSEIEEHSVDREDVKKVKKIQIKEDFCIDVNIVECYNDFWAKRYLKRREQIQKDQDFLKFLYDKRNKKIMILNLTSDGKVLSIQSRNQKKSNNAPRFFSYKYSDMMSQFFDKKIEMDEKVERIDRFSMIYNILRVNLESDSIYIFEGAMDANVMHMSGHPSIATLSAASKIMLDNGKYFYDNTTIDEEGKNQSIRMIQEDHEVFLWKEFTDDYPEFADCKDLNDIIMKQPDFDFNIFKKYFSDRDIDIANL